MMLKYIFTISLLIFSILSYGQTAHNFRKNADKDYSKGVYKEAEEKYRKALEEDPEVKGYFNLGNSLFQQQRYEEANEQYTKAIARTDDPLLQSKAYYNLGNTLFNEKKLEESLESYKRALRLNDKDEAAKRNLFLTRQLLKQQQQEQEQQQEQNKDQQKKEEEEEEQEKQDQEKQENKKEQEENQEQQVEENKKEQEQQEKQDSMGVDSLMQQKITREELMKLLKAIEEEDKKIQQKLRRGSSRKNKSEKDW